MPRVPSDIYRGGSTGNFAAPQVTPLQDQTANTISRVGGAVRKTGQRLLRLGQIAQTNIDNARTREAVNAYQSYLREHVSGPNGFRFRLGKDAIDSYQEVLEGIQKKRQELGRLLENDTQREMFARNSERMSNGAVGLADNHFAKQSIAYEDGQLEATLAGAQQDYVDYYGQDPVRSEPQGSAGKRSASSALPDDRDEQGPETDAERRSRELEAQGVPEQFRGLGVALGGMQVPQEPQKPASDYHLKTVRRTAERLAQIRGLTPEQADLFVKTKMAEAHSGVARRLNSEGRFGEAAEYLKRFGKELPANERATVQNTTRIGLTQERGLAVGRMVLDSLAPGESVLGAGIARLDSLQRNNRIGASTYKAARAFLNDEAVRRSKLEAKGKTAVTGAIYSKLLNNPDMTLTDLTAEEMDFIGRNNLWSDLITFQKTRRRNGRPEFQRAIKQIPARILAELTPDELASGIDQDPEHIKHRAEKVGVDPGYFDFLKHGARRFMDDDNYEELLERREAYLAPWSGAMEKTHIKDQVEDFLTTRMGLNEKRDAKKYQDAERRMRLRIRWYERTALDGKAIDPINLDKLFTILEEDQLKRRNKLFGVDFLWPDEEVPALTVGSSVDPGAGSEDLEGTFVEVAGKRFSLGVLEHQVFDAEGEPMTRTGPTGAETPVTIRMQIAEQLTREGIFASEREIHKRWMTMVEDWQHLGDAAANDAVRMLMQPHPGRSSGSPKPSRETIDQAIRDGRLIPVNRR